MPPVVPATTLTARDNGDGATIGLDDDAAKSTLDDTGRDAFGSHLKCRFVTQAESSRSIPDRGLDVCPVVHGPQKPAVGAALRTAASRVNRQPLG